MGKRSLSSRFRWTCSPIGNPLCLLESLIPVPGNQLAPEIYLRRGSGLSGSSSLVGLSSRTLKKTALFARLSLPGVSGCEFQVHVTESIRNAKLETRNLKLSREIRFTLHGCRGRRIAIRHILYEGEKMTKEGKAFLERERPDICIFGHTH